MTTPFTRSERARTGSSQSHSPSQSRPSSSRPSKLAQEYTPMPQVITEFAQLLVDNDDRFNQRLDEASQKQKLLHVQSLADSLRKHDAVRESAIRVQQQIEYERQAEQVRKEQEEARKVAQAKAKLHAEQQARLKRLEEERQREEERKQQEAQLKREQDEAARRQKEAAEQKAAREKAAQEKQEADRKDAERLAAQQKQQQEQQAQAQKQQREQEQQKQAEAQQQQKPSPVPPPPTSSTQASPPNQSPLASLRTPVDRLEQEHAAFLAMKQELKKSVAKLDSAKQNNAWLKENLGDKCRRRIRMLLGQVNKHDKKENTRVIREVQAILDDARTRFPAETLDISPFFLNGNPEPSQSPQFPLLLFDLLNHFAKAVVNQIATEAAVDRLMAEPIGIVTATIFANPNNSFHGHSLITILWARYHQRCPVLFGIWGDEREPAGRNKMGWKGRGEREHQALTRGLAAGFAAITLRDFSRNTKQNPAPNRLFWECIARIVNIPALDRLPTHYIALESLLDPIFVPRFIAFYGQAAIAALKLVTGEYAQLPPERGAVLAAAKRMETLKAKLSIDLNIWL